MRFGWFADPRAHVALLAIGLGALMFLPEMNQVTEQVEQRATETFERVAKDARLALGISRGSTS